MKPQFFFLLLSLAASAFAAETGYRLVHPDGSVEFSDTPIPGGEAIKLREAPTIKFAPAATPSTSGKQTLQRTKDKAATITINSPKAGQTLWFDEGGIRVSVSVSGALQAGEQVAISLDGKRVASGSGSSFNIGQVYRGSHTLSAAIVDSSGGIRITSPTVVFHLRQYSSIKPDSSRTNEPQPSPAVDYLPE